MASQYYVGPTIWKICLRISNLIVLSVKRLEKLTLEKVNLVKFIKLGRFPGKKKKAIIPLFLPFFPAFAVVSFTFMLLFPWGVIYFRPACDGYVFHG